jgi:hypothetical protein
MSRCVWALADEEVTEHMHRSEEGNAREWLATLTKTLSHSNQTRVFVTLWAIWRARRKAIDEQEYRSPLSVHLFVEIFIADLIQPDERRLRQPTVVTATAPARIPPPQGMLKINVDAGVGKNTGRGRVAAVARDSTGLFQGASAVVYPGRMDAETLEALACREAVSLALDVGA